MASYAKALEIDPRAAEARFGYGIALARLGRYREARDWFADAMARNPDRPDVTHALARLLASAPDDQVRDGRRAQALVDRLLKTMKTVDLGETLAMALAEQGQFDQAISLQRTMIESARRAGLATIVRNMSANLQRYERRQPCRMPWPADDPIHSPGPPVDPALAALAAP
jgi:tetratricopeptide (TPR) repeat protein